MTPDEVNSSNEQNLLDTVYNYKRVIAPAIRLSTSKTGEETPTPSRRFSQFKVGDYVRLSKYRMLFDKGYTPNWTTEIFKIRKVQYSTNPITYLLNDYQDNKIKGSVYAEELQSVKHPNVYLIEKILRKRNGQVYVKWLGFGSEHNSWVSEKDVL